MGTLSKEIIQQSTELGNTLNLGVQILMFVTMIIMEEEVLKCVTVG